MTDENERPRRKYHSPLRKERALQTRQAIEASAADLFAETGFGATTMQAIAERAGVSVEMVHAVGRKPELMQRAFAAAIERDAAVRFVDDQVLADAVAAGDPQAIAARIIRLVDDAGDTNARLWRAADVCALSVPSFSEHLTAARTQRLAGCRWLTDRLELDADLALDLLALTAPETRLQVIEDLGASSRSYGRWLTQAVLRVLR